MILCKVVGTVTASSSEPMNHPGPYLLLQGCNKKGEPGKGYYVALDTLGAGPGEMVLLSQGSSARQTESSDKKAIDAVIVGIVDTIEDAGEVVYEKSKAYM